MLKARIDGDALDETGLGFVLADEVGAEAAADLLGEFIRVFCDRGIVCERLQNERQVFDRHAFAEEVLQDALDDAEVDQVGEEFGDEGGVGLLDAVDERLDFLAREDEVGDLFEGFREVGDHHGCGIHDAVAIDFGGAFFFFCDPDGFNAEDGFACGDAFEVDHAAGDIHGKPAVGDH